MKHRIFQPDRVWLWLAALTALSSLLCLCMHLPIFAAVGSGIAIYCLMSAYFE